MGNSLSFFSSNGNVYANEIEINVAGFATWGRPLTMLRTENHLAGDRHPKPYAPKPLARHSFKWLMPSTRTDKSNVEMHCFVFESHRIAVEDLQFPCSVFDLIETDRPKGDD